MILPNTDNICDAHKMSKSEARGVTYYARSDVVAPSGKQLFPPLNFWLSENCLLVVRKFFVQKMQT